MSQVATPAPAPISIIRRPPRSALRPVKRLSTAPIPNSAAIVIAAAVGTGAVPMMNGTSGRRAPAENAMNDAVAAPSGEPRSSGLSPSSSRASV